MIRTSLIAVALFAIGCTPGPTGSTASSSNADHAAKKCGGFAGIQCASPDEFCKFDESQSCGEGDQMGVCTPKGEFCPEVAIPVCGCDGKDYGNSCFAAVAGVSVRSQGQCVQQLAQEGEECGGFVAHPRKCAAGLTCIASNENPDFPGTCARQFCGGIAGLACPDGYTCQLEGNFPDAGGTCVPTPVCEPVACALFCPNGMKQDANGCDTCECNATAQ
jgi:hypothetical protein